MISFEDVSFTHDGAQSAILRDVDLTIPEGDLTLVIGRTGSGKSTFLNLINGLVPHFTGGTLRGRVTVAGMDTGRTRRATWPAVSEPWVKARAQGSPPTPSRTSWRTPWNRSGSLPT